MTSDRKADHIDICLNKPISASYNYWDDVQLVHNALPELNLNEIDTEITLFNKKLAAPIIISAMTGGFKTDKYDSEVINSNLAMGAAACGIGMGVGSQRVAVIGNELERTYSVVKFHKVPLVIGNIGAPQLVPQVDFDSTLTVDDIKSAMELVGADIMAVHLNYLQEVCMVGGDMNAKGGLFAITQMVKEVPILAKETGAGISREAALQLKNAGCAGLDVGGLGGTSFAAVEMHRAQQLGKKVHKRLGKTFWNWGIPTPISVLEANCGLPMIATGGIRNGIDVARAIVLGANAGGIARKLLKAAITSGEAVTELLKVIILELKSTMFLLGAKNIEELQKCNYILTGTTNQWYTQLREQISK